MVQTFPNWQFTHYIERPIETSSMDIFKQGMKGPTRPAPTVPGMNVTRYSPVTNWDNDPFGTDLFEPTPNLQKKKPPPRPPPPKVTSRLTEVPAKPTHFIRKPTVLSSLLSRKTKSTTNHTAISVNSQQTFIPDFSEVDAKIDKIFPKCEPKNVQTGALIDLSSPPSSPTFTTRSSSDGLSVDSFGSDATTSTNHHNHHNGNASQAESGFEDDFDLFLNTRKIVKHDTMDNFADPFSPQPMIKPPIMKKPLVTKEFESVSQSRPTIIRAKPARPKPPDNSSLLKNTFGGSFPVTSMTVNTTTPIHKINGGIGDNFDKPFSWDDDRSPDRESSPPMPSIPPPPPPLVTDDDLPEVWPSDAVDFIAAPEDTEEDPEPHGIALFDYFTDHPDDLCFSANARIDLIRRVDHEWLFGRLRSGVEGTFPANYIEIKVPLPNEKIPSPPILATAVALYDFLPEQPGDLRFMAGDTILVQYKLNDEWYFGKCNGSKGQFPINYVQMS